MRSNLEPLLLVRTSSTVRLMSEKTPMLDRIIHNIATMTTQATPTATDSRNDIFMTDHGSTRETVSLTRRGATRRLAPGVPIGPPGASGRREPSVRTEVPVSPAVLTRCLLGCRLHPVPTLQYPLGLRIRDWHWSRFGHRHR